MQQCCTCLKGIPCSHMNASGNAELLPLSVQCVSPTWLSPKAVHLACNCSAVLSGITARLCSIPPWSADMKLKSTVLAAQCMTSVACTHLLAHIKALPCCMRISRQAPLGAAQTENPPQKQLLCKCAYIVMCAIHYHCERQHKTPACLCIEQLQLHNMVQNLLYCEQLWAEFAGVCRRANRLCLYPKLQHAPLQVLQHTSRQTSCNLGIPLPQYLGSSTFDSDFIPAYIIQVT